MFNKSDISRNACQLFGGQAKQGYDWWWHSFTGRHAVTGEEKPFYLLFNIIVAMIIMVNPFVAGVPSMIIHLVGIVSGIVCAVVYRKAIGDFFNSAEIF